MMRLRGLGILISAMAVSGCTSGGTLVVQPATPLPADPLVSVKAVDPAGLMTLVAVMGNAPGQRQTVTVSGVRMQVHGICVGTGSLVLDANGPGGQFLETVGCGNSWSMTNGFPVAGLSQTSSTDRYTVKVLLCGYVKQWAADVLGNGAVAADQSPTVETTPPSCPAA